MSWETSLDKYGELVETSLKEFISKSVKQAKNYHPFVGKIYRDIEEFVLRKGKRLASCSTLLIYKGYKNKIDDNILAICVGIELYRHAILIHDDLVDMDTTRRGEITLHKKFMNKYNPYNSHFGDGIALFTGNIVFSLAIKSIMESGFSKKTISEIVEIISEGYRAVNESQMLDLFFEQKDVSIEEWKVMTSKRAASLFKVTILIGAILGGATKSDFYLLENAAKNMGYSFDIQDDIIDTFANEKDYGRSTCLDISKNKKPLHVVYTLNSKNLSKSKALKCLLGKQFLSYGEKDLVRKIIRQSKGLSSAKKTSKEHAKNARNLILKTNLTEESKDFFKSFIFYIEESLDWYK